MAGLLIVDRWRGSALLEGNISNRHPTPKYLFSCLFCHEQLVISCTFKTDKACQIIIQYFPRFLVSWIFIIVIVTLKIYQNFVLNNLLSKYEFPVECLRKGHRLNVCQIISKFFACFNPSFNFLCLDCWKVFNIFVDWGRFNNYGNEIYRQSPIF